MLESNTIRNKLSLAARLEEYEDQELAKHTHAHIPHTPSEPCEAYSGELEEFELSKMLLDEGKRQREARPKAIHEAVVGMYKLELLRMLEHPEESDDAGWQPERP